jgi:plastocyanin
MMRGTFPALGLAALLILPVGCSDDPYAHVVDVQNFTYSPAQSELGAGDTILFVNHDVVPHTATVRDRTWDTGEIAAGDTARVAVPAAGEYFCVFHPNMTASVLMSQR